jgi:hypothetical protein
VGRLADRSDVLPHEHDRDGHNAKHGYGRLNATRACLLVSDPVTAALASMGEERAALAYLDLTRRDPKFGRPYSKRFGRWAARALLADSRAMHAAKVILRHARLVAGDVERFRAHGEGAVLRQMVLLLRGLLDNQPAPSLSRSVSLELARLVERLSDLSRSPEGRAAWDDAAYELFTDVAHRSFDMGAETGDPPTQSTPPTPLGAQLVRA